MRSHIKFELRTYEQEKDFVDNIEKNNIQKQKKEGPLVVDVYERQKLTLV
jgi:hypothetical protein